MNKEAPRNKDDRAQEHDQGIRERSGWCSSRRVLVQLTERAGWWIGDDDSHGVEISIAGGVRKMVRAQIISVSFFLFFFSFFFFLYHAFIVFRYKKLLTALAMEKTKPINQKPNIKNQTS